MRKNIVFVVLLLCLAGAASANVVIINGGSYTGRYTNGGNDVIVNDGQFNCSATDWAWPFENLHGTVTVNGGEFNGTASDAWGFGFVNEINSTVIINGGEFRGTASRWGKGFTNAGTAIITGGVFIGTASDTWGYGLENRGTATITGGSFSGIAPLWACGLLNYGTMTIYGTFAHYGELPEGGSFSGTLANGVYQTIKYNNQGKMYLKPVPEPSSILALLCGIGGMGGMMWRNRGCK